MATVRKELSPQEYLAIERGAETRSEFLRGEMFAMSGAKISHTLIKDNLAREAGNQLESGSCLVLTSDMRVKVNATGLYTYPDIAIVCEEPEVEDEFFDTLLNPLVIVEVLSESSEKYDRGKKFGHYRQVPSLREYVLISQERPLLERYVRETDGSWKLTVFEDPAGIFSFGTITVQVPMTKIYRGVKLRS